MTNTHQLVVSTTAYFSNIEEARSIAAAVDVLLSSGNTKTGGATLWDYKEAAYVPVEAPRIDESITIVSGGQEAEANATKYTSIIEKNREKVAGEISGENYWAEFIRNARKTGVLDPEVFADLVGERVGDPDAGLGLVASAIAQAASEAVTRSVQTARAQRVKTEKFAAAAAQQGKGKKN
jgi:hypothetical protein